MTTATDDRDGQAPAALPRNEELVTMPRCARCKLTYVPSKSTSALKLTYCSFLCELGDLGFSISGLEHMELVKKDAGAADKPGREPQPVGSRQG
jgi:hypothetical protein